MKRELIQGIILTNTDAILQRRKTSARFPLTEISATEKGSALPHYTQRGAAATE